jgi:Arc-like DNA binding domain
MALIDTREGMVVSNSRIPKELHRQLAAAAQRACRSLNSEIVWRLRQSVGDERGREESAA